MCGLEFGVAWHHVISCYWYDLRGLMREGESAMAEMEQQVRSWWAKVIAWLRGGQPAEATHRAKAALADLRDSETGRKAEAAIRDLREGEAGRKAKDALRDLRDSDAGQKAKDALRDLRDSDAGRRARAAIRDLRDGADTRDKT
jgi:hypothetical protein